MGAEDTVGFGKFDRWERNGWILAEQGKPLITKKCYKISAWPCVVGRKMPLDSNQDAMLIVWTDLSSLIDFLSFLAVLSA